MMNEPLSTTRMTRDQADKLTDAAMEVFAAAANQPFRQALLAVYVSGMQHAVAALKLDDES